jgi:hypothetical protein
MRPRRSIRRADNFDTFARPEMVDARGKLRVAVTNQETGRLLLILQGPSYRDHASRLCNRLMHQRRTFSATSDPVSARYSNGWGHGGIIYEGFVICSLTALLT